MSALLIVKLVSHAYKRCLFSGLRPELCFLVPPPLWPWFYETATSTKEQLVTEVNNDSEN